MDDNILQFPEKKKPEDKGWLTGPAKCLCCGGQWVAVSPVPTTWLDCPFCGCHKGVMEWPIYKFNIPHWTCNCGNDLFHITQTEIYCPMCGHSVARTEV